MTDNISITIRFANVFENNLYKLSKKYHNIKADVQPIIAELQKGNILGDRLAGFTANIYMSIVVIILNST